MIWLAALGIALALTGCHRHYPIEQATLPYKVSGASDPGMTMVRARLEKRGVQIITVGQNYLISIPSRYVFGKESPRIKWESYALLNDVVYYLKQFRKISVTVSAVADKCVSVKREQALTLARARAVSDYFWSQNIDSRFIFTQGLASDKPIAAFAKGGDFSRNSRIEITFREAVA